jgi:type IV pilus assembly protein PilM
MPPTSLAVDIGSYSIKMARIVPGRPQPRLDVLASIRTPADSIKEGEITDSFAVAEAIKELAHAVGVTPGTPCITAVGGPRVTARAHEMPAMPLAKLRTSILFEAERWLPFPVEDSIMEPEVVGERMTEQGRVQDVVIVAAPRTAVESHVETLRMAGLNCLEVDIEPFALLRSLIYASWNTDLFTKSIAIIRLGGAFSDITIVSRGQYVLCRPLPVAGNTFTRAVSDALGEPLPVAEQHKETLGQAGADVDLKELPDDERRVSQSMGRDLTELARELKLSVSFFQAEFQDQLAGANVEQVLLTGGSAMLNGMETFLSRALGIETRLTPYFDSLAIDTSKFHPDYVRLSSPSFAVAVGLALTPLFDQKQYRLATDPSIFGVALSKRRQGAQQAS